MFPVQEYQQRRANVRASMAELELNTLIITAPEDVYYLSGLNNQGHFVFTALILPAHSGTATLVAREMEAPTVAAQTADTLFEGYHDGDDPANVLYDLITSQGCGAQRIGYQAESLSFPVAVWQALDRRLSAPTWLNCAGLLSAAQAIRSDREIAYLREAARLSDIGMQAGIAATRGPCSGREIVGEIQEAMLSAGSDYPGQVPMVRTIEQIRQEHVAWTAEPLTPADSLYIELSAASARYHSPLARTLRSHERREGRAAHLAATGLEAIAAALRPGRTAEDAYRDWKSTIETGLGHSYQRHHCGYTVGIGFPPNWMSERLDSLRPGNHLILRAGMTFHIQSWVLDEHIGMYAISDTALVTTDGSELLTTTTRHPVTPR